MKQERTAKRRWRTTTWLWIVFGFGTMSGLIYWDQIAWLYVLSTTAVTILMIIVAFSDLKGGAEDAVSADEQQSKTAPNITGNSLKTAPLRGIRKQAH